MLDLKAQYWYIIVGFNFNLNDHSLHFIHGLISEMDLWLDLENFEFFVDET